MDPQITWHSMLAAWTRGDWLEVIDLAEALLEWLDKDGFPPKTVAAPELGAQWHRVVTGAAAKFALAHATAVLEHPDGVPTIVAFTLTCAHATAKAPRPTRLRSAMDGRAFGILRPRCRRTSWASAPPVRQRTTSPLRGTRGCAFFLPPRMATQVVRVNHLSILTTNR